MITRIVSSLDLATQPIFDLNCFSLSLGRYVCTCAYVSSNHWTRVSHVLSSLSSREMKCPEEENKVEGEIRRPSLCLLDR